MHDPQDSVAPSLPSRVRFIVTAWLSCAAICAYLCRNSLVVAEEHIRKDLDLSMDTMGFILGPAFFWTYALAQIPTAWLGERFGSRRCLPLFATAWSLATAALGWATGTVILVASRSINGITQAGLFPSATRTISDWHPQNERGFSSGMLGASMSIGGVIGAGLTGWLLGFWHWKTIFILYAIPGILWAVGFRWWFRDRPEDHTSVNEAELNRIRAGRVVTKESKRPTSRAGVWLQLVSSPAAWMICGQQFFRAGAYAFFASWFATYLRETRGVSLKGSGLLTALPLIATVLGSAIGGMTSDAVFRRTDSLSLARKGVAAGSLILCSIMVFLAYFVDDPTTAVLVISTGAFLAAFAGPCSYSISMDMGGNHVASVFSTMNMIGNFGAGLAPWLVPTFMRAVEGNPTLLTAAGGNKWNSILILFACMYLASGTCWLFLRLNGTVFDQAWLGRHTDSEDR